MRWLCMPRNGQPVKDIIKEALSPHKVLDIAIVNMRTAYIAFESPHGGIAAGVFLLQYRPKAYYDFCYKDMDESVGPVECDCPERILKLLTAEPIGYAKEWRAKCWLGVASRERILSGAPFRLPAPIKFNDGISRSRFRHWKRNRYICLDTQVQVTIRSLNVRTVIFE